MCCWRCSGRPESASLLVVVVDHPSTALRSMARGLTSVIHQDLHSAVASVLMHHVSHNRSLTLQSKWGTLFPGSDSAFWQHEWDKHGTCAMTPKLRGQIQYFKQTVQLLDDLHIMDWLRESGIIPLPEKDSRSFPTSLIHSSLENHTDGKRIRLDCKRIRQSNEAILVGFHVCYAPLTLEFTDCPGRGDGRCGSHVRFVKPFSTSLVANNPVTSAPSLSDPQGEHETFLDSDE